MNETASKVKKPIEQFLASKRIPLWIFLAGVALFTVGYRPEFIGFQTRFGLFAKEMLRNGVTFFPTTYGIPYPDYPATSTILIWLVSLITGKVTPLTAVLPTAVVSSLILVLIYKIGALKDKMWGLCAVLIALLTYDFVDESRTISLDQYSSLMTILSFYIVYTADWTGRKGRLWFVPLCLIGGFVFRGPIGLVVPAAVTGGYYLWKGDYKKVLITGVLSLVLLALCFGALLWAARIQGGESFSRYVFDSQAGGRVGGPGRKPVFYYFLSGLTHYGVAYPLALLVLIYTFKEIVKKRNDHAVFLGHMSIWMLIVLAGFTVVSTKAMRYILPFVPAVSLMAAYLFINASTTGKLHPIRNLVLWFCGALPIIAFCAGVGHLVYLVSRSYPFHWFYGVTLVFLGGVILASRHVEKRWADYPHRNLVILALGAAAFVGLQIGFIEPVRYDSERTGPFVEKTVSLVQQHDGKIAFFKINPDGDAIKFMVNLESSISPEFVTEPSQLTVLPSSTCYIAKAKEFARLPEDVAKQMQVICEGDIGHTKCVVFTPVIKENVSK